MAAMLLLLTKKSIDLNRTDLNQPIPIATIITRYFFQSFYLTSLLFHNYSRLEQVTTGEPAAGFYRPEAHRVIQQ